jgi:dolichyl-phosphate-mannose-protein mannosyltransferase
LLSFVKTEGRATLRSGASLTALLAFLLIFFVQGLYFIRENSPTYDEAMHIASGYSYLATGDFRLEPQNPPLIKEILTLPLFLGYGLPFNPDAQHWRAGDRYLIGQRFLYESTVSADRILFLTRIPNLVLGGAVLALIGWWAYRLWGPGAAILGLALGSLEPNLIAHSSLVTTDIGAALFIFLTVYLFWEYLRTPRWWVFVIASISTGLALVAKFSTILVMPLISILLGASFVMYPEARAFLPMTQSQAKLIILRLAKPFFVVALCVTAIISLAYGFQGISAWLSGLQRFVALAREGQPAFFMGEYSYDGWWNYFLVAFLIKTPLGSLILIGASLLFYRAGNSLGRREAIFILLPVIVIFVLTSQSKVNIGLRHILSVYPFLFVLASRLATVRFRRRWLVPLLVGAPLVMTAVSAIRIAPHQLAYFNELVGGPDQGYRYLSDSNLDWGQDLKGVKAYMDKENLSIIYLSYFGTAPPEYYGIRYQYVPGNWPLEWPRPRDKVLDNVPRKILAISVTNLQDVGNPYDPLFRWLWTRRPIAKIGYSIFVYDLSNDREALTKLEQTYAKAGIKLPS